LTQANCAASTAAMPSSASGLGFRIVGPGPV